MFRQLALALASVTLLVAAFPPCNQPWAAWVALAPWLFLLRTRRGRGAWWWSYAVGALFFVGSITWLMNVTVAGWLLLCAYLGIFFGAFGWLAAGRGESALRSRRALVLVPAAWTALEFGRTHIFSGFGWNPLSQSQPSWLPVAQIADLTGHWGVSFLLVLMNVAVVQWLAAAIWQRTAEGERLDGMALAYRYLAVPAALVLAATLYGVWRIRSLPAGEPARVAVLQGNIPQEEKWDDASKERILAQYDALAVEAAAQSPALIVWPETSVPDYLGVDEEVTERVLALSRRVRTPMLIGTPYPHFDGGRFVYLNRASLLDADGHFVSHYDKLHLVPYGEFLPGEQWFGWMRGMLPPIGDFVSGKDATVFRHDGLPPFGVLICFEDIFPDLARRFVRQGARMLAVITNDAWFGPTGAAVQHAQASAYRAVELRVPVVRAANTGWSGCIDAAGRWTGSVRDAQGKELFVTGTHACEVRAGDGSTLYARWGDWFAWVCVLATAAWLATGIMSTSPRSLRES
jgi:apolipoprotein N-acyltransferase